MVAEEVGGDPHDNYNDGGIEVKRVVWSAKRVADARRGRRLCDIFYENKKKLRKEVKRVSKGKTGSE